MEQEALYCPACGSNDIAHLPAPHGAQAMASDGRIVPKKLQKCSCLVCGYGFHASPPSSATLRGLYDGEYDLGLRDRKADQERAANYAEQIGSLLLVGEGAKLVELGCGSGNLLKLLAARLKCELAVGVEPSERLAEAAQSALPANIQVMHAFAEDYAEGTETVFDICLSVNVAEHALDPSAFLRAGRKLIKPQGVVLVVCPDGEVPSSELLFYDHISSFTPQSLAFFAHEAGLALVSSSRLGGVLSGFCAHVFHLGQSAQAWPSNYFGLAAERSRYLALWQGCERAVQDASSGRSYAVFGTGEFTNLLAAYSPSAIDRAAYFVVDEPSTDKIFDKSIVATKSYLSSSEVDLLAAVNERSWASVLGRFSALNVRIAHPFHLNFWSNHG